MGIHQGLRRGLRIYHGHADSLPCVEVPAVIGPETSKTFWRSDSGSLTEPHGTL